MTPATPRRTLSLVLILAVSAVTLSSCGGSARSVASYCSYFYGEGGKLRERWLRNSQSSTQDPMAALASVFADLPEAASFLHQLALRAPEDIAPDVQALSDALQHATEANGGSDPLSALASGLLGGLAATGAEQRVNQYTEQHCGGPPS
jgi:hypothetical protein